VTGHICPDAAMSIKSQRQDLIIYLTSSESDDHWLLKCIDAGRMRVGPNANYPPSPELHPQEYSGSVACGRVLHEYQLIMIAEGSGWLRSRGLVHEIKSGDAFLLFPGICHSYAPNTATGWEERWVGFSGEDVDKLVSLGFFSSETPVYRGAGDMLIAEFDRLLDDASSELPGHRLIAASRVLVLLSELEASRRRRSLPEGSERLARQAALILENRVAHRFIEIDEIASELGLSALSFKTLFKDYTGLSPHQYWLSLKVNKAKALLLNGGSVKETAYSLGFESEFYFSRLFKKKTGIAPSEWARAQ
jgi:AraC-like DNA-binding protein